MTIFKARQSQPGQTSDHSRLMRIVVISILLVSPSVSAQSWWDKGRDWLFGADRESTNGSTEKTPASVVLTNDLLIKGFTEALQIGVDTVVNQLGQHNGYNKDNQIRIKLPPEFDGARSVMEKVGIGQVMDQVEEKLNRAAETAVPETRALLLNAITELTFEDIQAIYSGPKDSATRYFREKMTPELKQVIRPIVNNSLSEVGAIAIYDDMLAQYHAIPFAPRITSSIEDQVVDGAMEGIFYYLAREEEAIRSNPAKRTTEILKTVFSATAK